MDNYQQLRSDLWTLADEIEQLSNKVKELYHKHPNDIMDLGESYGLDTCYKKIIKLLEK